MRSNRRSLVVLALSLVVLAAACGGGSASTAGTGATSSPGNAADDGQAPADFTAPLLAGGEFAAASLEGRNTVLWFWAPWCTSCRAEAPDVVAAAEAFAGDVDVIGVAGRGEVSEMQAFVDDTGTAGLSHVIDADGSIWSAFGVFAQPAFAFVDDTGSVDVFVGALGEKALTERMTALGEA
jgi:thiol-disulfide isomerase/thioredoxin